MLKSLLQLSTLATLAPLALVGIGLAAGAGCSPYDPNLGNSPYLCAAAEPRCPDSYTCDETFTPAICVAPGGAPPGGPDAPPGGFQCAMDGPLEPNDSYMQAYQTDVGVGATMRIYGPISICPEGDVDHFQINIMSPNQGLEVITSWDSGMPVKSEILNRAGTTIANGTAMGANAIRACTPNLPVDLYYAKASAAANVKNNYRIEMRIVAACN